MKGKEKGKEMGKEGERKGREDKEKGERSRLAYLSRGTRVPSYATDGKRDILGLIDQGEKPGGLEPVFLQLCAEESISTRCRPLQSIPSFNNVSG